MNEYLKTVIQRNEDNKAKVKATVKEMLDSIKEDGEAAIRHYSQKYDNWNPKSFKVSRKEIDHAFSAIPESMKNDIDFCQAQIRNFASEQRKMYRDMEVDGIPGVRLGQKCIPVDSSGSYVPGGRYPMLASAHMTVITPKVAGVERVVAVSPPVKGEGIYPATLYSMVAAGADEIYCLGGVQAMAALAYGSIDGLRPVDIVVGAGNKFVTEAKRQIFGDVGIDLLAGPTEILCIVDHSADPVLVAADILSQAEHDPNSRQCLISIKKSIAKEIMKEIERQLEILPTADIARSSWTNFGEVIVVDSKKEALRLCNEWAPEHIEIHTEDWQWYLNNCKNYGSMFCGEETTVAYGDKTIGTNHVLPTMKSARYTGGLSVGKFIKIVTYQYSNREASKKIAQICERACNYENMIGHGISCSLRIKKYK